MNVGDSDLVSRASALANTVLQEWHRWQATEMGTLTPKRARLQCKNTAADNFLHRVTQYTHYRVTVALKNDELIEAAGIAGDVMRAASLLNSGADIQTEGRVCYILTTEKFTFSIGDR